MAAGKPLRGQLFTSVSSTETMTAAVRGSLETGKLQNHCSTMQGLGTAETGGLWKDRWLGSPNLPLEERGEPLLAHRKEL